MGSEPVCSLKRLSFGGSGEAMGLTNLIQFFFEGGKFNASWSGHAVDTTYVVINFGPSA